MGGQIFLVNRFVCRQKWASLCWSELTVVGHIQADIDGLRGMTEKISMCELK